MMKPVQITFRNMRASASLEDEVRARVAWLERFYPDLVGCRVLLELPHRHHEHGQHVRVRIELSLPGEDVVVSHEPTLHGRSKDVQEEAHHKDTDIDPAHKLALVAIHDAFDAARRRLEDFARRQRGAVKTHPVPDHGRVASLPEGEDYGFIETEDGRQLYFQRGSVLDAAFTRLTLGAEVAFVEEQGEKGPQASTVRLLGKHHYVAP